MDGTSCYVGNRIFPSRLCVFFFLDRLMKNYIDQNLILPSSFVGTLVALLWSRKFSGSCEFTNFMNFIFLPSLAEFYVRLRLLPYSPGCIGFVLFISYSFFILLFGGCIYL